ncbi:hypothetical protein KR51_00006580 [Rubidibacter lacunae KORDI 51-2]|uniref:Flagellar assembly protein H n=1 Tax=Rubidibacter lacunae KORDI 51-2 TaxID=582515 RepID=U5DSH3_9CHRO|nr:hypothetical protein [Rubidibacter lacunae]ERN42630.1 hypothetical protein KR51_00006580 [Rubidibacter lacunae KORDI 51-2]
MTSKPFDAYSKEYLQELLAPTGEVVAGLESRDEARQIDVWYVPDPQLTADRLQLGLLGRMAAQPCIFEPYSHRPDLNQVRSCVMKLLVTLFDALRAASRDRLPAPTESELPRLWILSPSASPTLMKRIGGKPDPSWPEGIYFTAELNRAGFVALDGLPETEETLWLRLLGRGRTLKQAIAEVLALPPAELKRDKALQLLASWKTNIEGVEYLNIEDRELAMTLSPAFVEWERRAREESLEQGLQQGLQQGLRLTLQTLLASRFGRVDDRLESVIGYFAGLTPEEYTEQFPTLLSLSRDELVARFGARDGNGNGA